MPYIRDGRLNKTNNTIKYIFTLKTGQLLLKYLVTVRTNMLKVN